MGRKIRRAVGAVLIALSIALAAVPVEDLIAARYVDQFQMDHDEIAKYTGTATAVSVSDAVKSIGSEAFANQRGMYTIDLGNNTKVVKEGAFAGCVDLTNVTMHDTLESIESASFAGCKNLNSINIGAGVESIGYGIFAGCDSLAKVTISRNNDQFINLGGGLYDNNINTLYAYLSGYDLTYYNMPDSVTKISKFAFWGNNKLDTVSLSSYLVDIPAYSFSNCKNLKEINIPYSVTTIGPKAFENCISLYDVIIPPSVSYIDPTAFDGCVHLNIVADPGTVAYDYFKNFDNSDVRMIETGDTTSLLHIIDSQESNEQKNDEGSSDGSGSGSGEGSGVNVESGSGKDYKESVTEIVPGIGLVDASTDPSNVEYMPKGNPLDNVDDSGLLAKTIIVGGRAVLFLDPSAAATNGGTVVQGEGSITDDVSSDIEGGIDQPADGESGENTPADGTVGQDDASGETVIYDPQKGGYLPKYKEFENMIASQAYYAAKGLNDYEIESGITEIGDFAFARSTLNKITIPEGVKKIGYGAFYHCDSLSDVSIPSTVTEIDAYAFENTPYLTNLKSNVGSNDFAIVGDGILLAYCGQGRDVTIPSTVKTIAPGAFMDKTAITSVTIPDSVLVIGDDAFRGCTSLSSVTGGDKVTRIGDRAFMNCPLDSLSLSPNVETMGLRAVDFSDSAKNDATKVVVFRGNHIPAIEAGTTSRRLENYDYREDVLHGVLFAVVDDSITDYKDTVLDGEKLGFSGLIVSPEKDASGNDTGSVVVKKNYIYSEEVLAGIPDYITVKGNNYKIKDRENLTVADNVRKDADSKKELTVLYDGQETNDITASFSEDEKVGPLNIRNSETAASALSRKYADLFGGESEEMMAYDISLKDPTDTVDINRFGQATMTVTMHVPDEIKGDRIHVIALDADGQLEEISSSMVSEDVISFQTNHLSYFGIYATDSGSSGLSILNGKLVKNYKLDDSPNTGDHSLPIKYVVAFMTLCVGVFLIVYKKKRVA